jgi:hypothetical protein
LSRQAAVILCLHDEIAVVADPFEPRKSSLRMLVARGEEYSAEIVAKLNLVRSGEKP